MKRIMLFTLVIGLFAVQADAAMFEMDAVTAGGMTLLTPLGVSGTDLASMTYSGYNPGNLAANKISGTSSFYGATMAYAVGFKGTLEDDDQNDNVSALIGLSSPSIIGTFDGFLLPISNDNDDVWEYRAYVTVSGTSYSSPRTSVG